MNTPMIFENAIRATIFQFCPDSIPSAWVHIAQQPADIYNENGTIKYPQVLIVANGKARDGNGATWNTEIRIDCAVHSAEDRTGDIRASLYESIEDLFENFLEGNEGIKCVKYFCDQVRAEIPTFCLGGFSPEASDASTISDGIFIGTFSGTLHYDY